jgi:hypothetical protein
MQTAEERLKFAVRFIQMDITHLRAGDRLNLNEDLLTFLFPDTATDPFAGALEDSAAFPHNDPSQLSANDLVTLQREVLEVLLGVVKLRERPKRDEPASALVFLNLNSQLQVTPGLAVHSRHGDTRVSTFFVGPFRDAFLMQLIMSLIQLPLDTLRACPECGTIFYRVRKQRYCSRRCTNRANMRAWRQSVHGKARESDLNHSRYHARVKRTISPKATVARRPTGPRSKTQGGRSDGEGEATRQS